MDYLVGDVLKLLDDRKLDRQHGRRLLRRPRLGAEPRQALAVRQRHCACRSSSAGRGRSKPGSVRDDLVCFLDLAPTVLSLAGAEVPPHMQGRVILGDEDAAGPEVRVRGPRPDGRDVRPHPQRPRRALPLRPQLPPGAAVHPVHQLHGRDADHAGLAAARVRGEAEPDADALHVAAPSRRKNSTTSRPTRTRSRTSRRRVGGRSRTC